MELSLKGKVAVIWGAAGGIGAATAAEFAAEGAQVALVDRAGDALSSLADQLTQEFGTQALPLVADVTDPASVANVADQVWNRWGQVNTVMYCVAVGSGGFGFPSWNVDAAAWQTVLNVNLIGAVRVAQSFGPRMAAAGRGCFLWVSSVAGQIGSQTDPPYSASKAGLINFAQCLARDLASAGVRVNTLCPGMIRTPLVESIWRASQARDPAAEKLDFEAWAAQKITKLVPLGRWQQPEDIAAMAVFLASDRAANITGQTINVDGGYVMHW